MNKVLYSSKTCEWSTPQDLFDELDAEFHFELDTCATSENAKCARFYTARDDGLARPWDANVCWCNPPYGRSVSAWVAKAAQSANEGRTVVMLLPARTDTKWFHEYIYGRKDVEIRFLKGRVKFGGVKYNAPFPCMVVVFKGRARQRLITNTANEGEKRENRLDRC